MKLLITALAAVFLCSCAQIYPPAISDVSPFSVRVQADSRYYHEIDLEAVEAEAERGCGLYGKQISFVSSRCVLFDASGNDCMMQEFLYLCR